MAIGVDINTFNFTMANGIDFPPVDSCTEAFVEESPQMSLQRTMKHK